MKASHKDPYQGYLDHAQMTNSTDFHLQQVEDNVCPEDAAAAAVYAPRTADPYPQGSWQANNAARFR